MKFRAVGLSAALIAGLFVGDALADPVPTVFPVTVTASTLPLSVRPYTFTFALYDVPTGGTALWSESKLCRLPATKKLTHQLGSVDPAGNPISPLLFNRQLWLEASVGTRKFPRVKLDVAPYAVRSELAGNIEGQVTAAQVDATGAAPGNVLTADGSGAASWHPVAGSAGGTVTQVDTGAGLTGGPITGMGTISVATGGIAESMIAAGAVTDVKLADGAVSNAKITGPIATSKLNVGTSAGTVAAGDHTHAGMGDITAVNTATGSGLTGGSGSGDVSLAVDTAAIQARVGGTCAPGSSIRAIAGDGSVTCEADDVGGGAGSGWALGGNAGTTPGMDFVGTTDNQALEVKVNNARALRIEPTAGTPNLLGGFADNAATALSRGAAIGGGGQPSEPNLVTDDFGTVGGGAKNVAGNENTSFGDANFATVGGGQGNKAQAQWSTVAGGSGNSAAATHTTVAGGWDNAAGAQWATVGGGQGNSAGGTGAAVAGGMQNKGNGLQAAIGGGYLNEATQMHGVVAGGTQNKATGQAATVGGGSGNEAGGHGDTIGGGVSNLASSNSTVVAGGLINKAMNEYAAVGGGMYNLASGVGATVPGGWYNQAGGDKSLAAGYQAVVRDATASGDLNGDEGTFVWADAQGGPFTSTGPNQFLVRAQNGVGINRNNPSSALDVNGTVTATGLRLTTTPAAGYVLTSDAGGNGSWQPVAGSAGGTVTQVATGAGLTGGPITGAGTISVATGGIANGMLADGAVTDTKITGPIATSKLEVGTTTGTVAAGDHAHAGMGDITAVNTAAMSGLTGGATAGDANLAVVGGPGILVDGSGVSVSFAGAGAAATAARSDHDHSATGVNNTSVGSESLPAITTGTGNTASGSRALFSNTSGIDNTAVGRAALQANTSGSYNTAVGSRTLAHNTEGVFNTAVGEVALFNNTTGSNNAAFGTGALPYNTTGWENSAFGAGSLYSNSSGSENTASGFQALFSNTSGATNTASGYKAMHANVDGYNNTAAGAYSLFANVAGAANTAAGFFALNANTASYNTAVGDSALRFNATGENNTAAGFRALMANTGGAGNAAVGVEALASNAAGGGNTAMGYRSLYLNPGGGGNTAVGSEALSASLAGDANTAVGSRAAATLAGGLGNTFLGAGADATTTSLERATAIGYNAKVGSSNSLVLGGTGADAVKVGIGTATPGQDLAIGSLVLDVRGRSRLVGSSGATANTAGTWLSTLDAGTVTDRAFVGLKDDGLVGFYGAAGSDWSLLMDAATGEVLAGKDVRIAGTATMSGFNLSTAPGDGYFLMSDASGNGSWQPIVGNAGGTVTQVNTGAGLTGGPFTVAGTISVAASGIANTMLADGAVTDAKITGPIATSKLSVGTSAGTVAAGDHAHVGMGDITAVNTAPGSGLTGGAESDAVSLAVDTSTIQARVSGTCAPGSSIRTIAADGTVACETDDIGDGTGGSAWSVTGNAGTNPATNFIGTTDDTALEFRVNNQRALRLERVTADVGGIISVGQNTLGGDAVNWVTPGVTMATIAGGGGTQGLPYPNSVTDHGGTVGGGQYNQAGNGSGTLQDALYATVAGGVGNKANGSYATVAGGSINEASGHGAFVGGGGMNKASGDYSAVPGGEFNTAGGEYSFAAGWRANVRTPGQTGDSDGDQGTFVWSDRTPAEFTSTGPNQFLIRAAGGVGVNTNAPQAALHVAGDVKIDGSAQHDFSLRQKVNLWGNKYGIGVQNNRQYFRADAGQGFAWFSGGSHNDTADDPGAGGALMMNLTGSGNLHIGGTLGVAGDTAVGRDLTVGRTLDVTSALSVGTTATVGGPMLIGGTLGVGGDTAVGRDLTVGRTLDITSALSVGTTATVGGPMLIGGNLDVGGTLTKGGGSFKIDHPLDPQNRYLSHSFVESPDMMNIYNGNVTTDERGYATVELPAWFGALNRDFRYQLTVVDEADGEGFVQAKVVRGVAENRFTIRTSAPGVTVSWQVTGIRQDPYANAHRIPVEEEKPLADRGKCLHAEACGEQLAQGR